MPVKTTYSSLLLRSWFFIIRNKIQPLNSEGNAYQPNSHFPPQTQVIAVILMEADLSHYANLARQEYYNIVINSNFANSPAYSFMITWQTVVRWLLNFDRDKAIRPCSPNPSFKKV